MARALVVLCLCLGQAVLSLPAVALASGAQNGTPAAAVTGPLHTSGAKILDAQGQEVRLTGVNWFGLETNTFAPHGLWARNYGDMLDQIVAAGFNTVRLPYSNQLFDAASKPQGIDFQKNPDLQGLSGLQIMDKIVTAAGQRGLSVLLDRHRPTAAAQSELWYTPEVPESKWIQDWVMLAKHYSGNSTVIGADLHNEPHGPATWGSGDARTDWRSAAERAGDAILAANADWLIVVEGIEHNSSDWYWWGGNLSGARDTPVRLSAPDKLVYSPHDYGPGVYQQSWFHAADFPANLPKIWHDHWAFLQQDNVAPVLIGEFGGRSVGSDAEGVWQRSLLGYLRDNNLSYTYWAWNPDSGDTGGILADDWKTLDQRKLAMLEGYQWPATAATSAPVASAPVAAQPSGSADAPASADTAAAADSAGATADSPGAAQAPAAGGAAGGAQASGTPAAADDASLAARAPPPSTAGVAAAPGPADDASLAAGAPGAGQGPEAPVVAVPNVVTPPVGVLAVPPAAIAQPVPPPGGFASGGPFDPDLQHALQGIGGPNDPDAAHRQARERDERQYLALYGKPWQYAAYVKSASGL